MYLFYGNGNALPQNDFKLYNFNSIKEKGIRLNLFPQNSLGAIDEYDFDCRYANYIMTDDFAFMNMMSVVMDLYSGINVFILADEDDFYTYDGWNAILVQSFMKLLQQRYGINGTKIDNHWDMENANPTEFSEYGILNLDVDKERYSYLIESQRIMSGGKPYTDEQ